MKMREIRTISGSFRRFAALAALAALAAGGCARAPLIEPEMPPIVYPQASKATAGPGSLWVAENNSSWSLIRDDKAREVGDLVMVDIVTRTTANAKADTDLKRESDIKADIANFFGYETMLPRSDVPASGVVPPLISSSSNSKFESEGATNREGRISARISAMVTHVYPNGNMRIFGSQAVAINNERTILTVDGIIRPSDVTLNNSVLSTQIANARIEYTGRGVLADVQRPGILMRAFGWLWPF